jgi:multisubunit Na+/H+ antiporter MnhB subunit
VLFLAFFLAVMAGALQEMPRFGMPLAQAAANYAGIASLTGSLNIVLSIALSLRAYDTLGGLFVLFAAALGVGMIMHTPGRRNE